MAPDSTPPDSFADLATPIAKALARVSRSAAGRERFDSALLAFEVLLKYAGCVALAGLNQLHRDSCYAIEYGLSRDIALGSWLRCLQKAIDGTRRASKNTDVPEWLWAGLKWFERKRSPSRDRWFVDTSKSALEVQRLLKRDGDLVEFRFVKVSHLLEFLTHVRNKTRGHGAKPESFFRATSGHLVAIVHSLAIHSSWCGIELLSRIPGTFRDCLVLRGATPTERMTLEGHVNLDPNRSVLLRPTGAPAAHLPRLMEYRFDDDRCLFANDAFQPSTRRMEFMDYFSGNVAQLTVPYAVEPVHQDRIGDVCEFRKTSGDDTSARSAASSPSAHR